MSKSSSPPSTKGPRRLRAPTLFFLFGLLILLLNAGRLHFHLPGDQESSIAEKVSLLLPQAVDSSSFTITSLNSNRKLGNASDTTQNERLASKQWILPDYNTLLHKEDSPLAGLPETDLILCFVNEKYIDVLSVWLQYYQKVQATYPASSKKVKILGLITLSPQSYTSVRNGLNTFLKGTLGNVFVTQLDRVLAKGGIWERRIKFLESVFTTWPHVNVVVTDLDAIWVKNPFQLLDGQYGQASVVASQDTFPPRCGLGQNPNKKDLKITICFGFVYFRNQPAVRDMVRRMRINFAKYSKDDQVAINCVLTNSYNVQKEVQLEGGGLAKSLLPTTGEKTSKSFAKNKRGTDEANNKVNDMEAMSQTLELVVLPYTDVYRHCGTPNFPNTSVVVHCSVAKVGATKIKGFRNMGLWHEDDSFFNWNSETAD